MCIFAAFFAVVSCAAPPQEPTEVLESAQRARYFNPPPSMRDRDIELTLSCKREGHRLSGYDFRPDWTTTFTASAVVRVRPGDDYETRFRLLRRFEVVRMDDSLFIHAVPPDGGKIRAFGPMAVDKTSGAFGDEGYADLSEWESSFIEEPTQITWRRHYAEVSGHSIDHSVSLIVKIEGDDRLSVALRYARVVDHFQGHYPFSVLTCTGTSA